MGLHRHIRHARISVDRAHRVPYGFILLHYGQMALVGFLAVPHRVDRGIIAAIEQKFRQFDILLAFAAAFRIVHEAAETHQSLLHFLMAVIPRFLRRRTRIGIPAIGQLAALYRLASFRPVIW